MAFNKLNFALIEYMLDRCHDTILLVNWTVDDSVQAAEDGG